jgi:hypothetical protein
MNEIELRNKIGEIQELISEQNNPKNKSYSYKKVKRLYDLKHELLKQLELLTPKTNENEEQIQN